MWTHLWVTTQPTVDIGGCVSEALTSCRVKGSLGDLKGQKLGATAWGLEHSCLSPIGACAPQFALASVPRGAH